MTVYGADADELDALAAEFRRVADDIERGSSLLTRTISNLSWFGDVATAFMSDWTGANVPRIGLSTRFLRDAADELQRNAAQQRTASDGTTGGSGTVPDGPRAFTTRPQPVSPGQQLEAQMTANQKRLVDHIASLDANDPLRQIITERLGDGYRVLAFDPSNNYLALASPNFGSTPNVVVAIPGTGTSMWGISRDAELLHKAYGEDTAVDAALVWEPPHNLVDNINLNARERTLQTGPLGQMLDDLHATGRSVVVTGHSAGGAAVQTFFSTNPDYFDKVAGIAALAPAEVHTEFAVLAAAHGTPAIVAVHTDDPINVVHGDVHDMAGKIVADAMPGVDYLSRASYDRSLPPLLAGLPDATMPVNLIGGHDHDGYVYSFGEQIKDMFPGTEQLPDGMVRQRVVDADGTVFTVDTGTF